MTEWFIRYLLQLGSNGQSGHLGSSKMGLCFHNGAALGQAAQMLNTRPCDLLGMRLSCHWGCGHGQTNIQKVGRRQ